MRMAPDADGSRLVEHTVERLRALGVAAGLSAELTHITETFRRLVTPWAHARAGWASEIADDHTPVELSVAFAGGTAELRALFEPQGREPSVSAYRAAGLAFHDELQAGHGAELGRFRMLQDLFVPEDMQGPFAVWSSVVFAAGARPTFKTYFNPQARGRARAQDLVEEALRRLGLPHAMSALRASALERGPELDEIKYVALDLTATASARVKIYVRHHRATPQELEHAARAAESYVPGEALELARELSGGDEPLAVRAAATCSAFTSESPARPVATTLYVPVCAYARDDAMVLERVREYLVRRDLDPTRYEALVTAFANRPLGRGIGMQSWFAVRRDRGVARFTVYLATEANRVFPAGSVPAPSSPDPVR